MVVYVLAPNSTVLDSIELTPSFTTYRACILGAGDQVKSPISIPNPTIADRYDIGAYDPTTEFLAVGNIMPEGADITLDPLICYVNEHAEEYRLLLAGIVELIQEYKTQGHNLPEELLTNLNVLAGKPASYANPKYSSVCPIAGVVANADGIKRTTIFELVELPMGDEPISFEALADTHMRLIDNLDKNPGLSATLYWNTTSAGEQTLTARVAYNGIGRNGGTYQSSQNLIRVGNDEV